MFVNLNLIKLVISAVIIIGCTNYLEAKDKQETSASLINLLQVYKGAQCGCCNGWISHMKENGFQTEAHNLNDLYPIKQKYGIEPRLQSCHTSVSKSGYIFEGHIPAKFIKQFLDEKPEGAIGLAVPSMPVGSPGMEHNNMFRPYVVYLLKADGSIGKYAKVQTADEQF